MFPLLQMRLLSLLLLPLCRGPALCSEICMHRASRRLPLPHTVLCDLCFVLRARCNTSIHPSIHPSREGMVHCGECMLPVGRVTPASRPGHLSSWALPPPGSARTAAAPRCPREAARQLQRALQTRPHCHLPASVPPPSPRLAPAAPPHNSNNRTKQNTQQTSKRNACLLHDSCLTNSTLAERAAASRIFMIAVSQSVS